MKLSEVPLLVIDVQTDGGSYEDGRVIEFAFAVVRAEVTEPITVQHTLVRLDADRTFKRAVQRMTGIKRSELDAAPDESVSADMLAQALTSAPFGLAHVARFEKAHLEALWQRVYGRSFPLDFLCTHAIARRLWPELPSHSLRAVAGHLGHPNEATKRAAPQIEATAHIWRHAAAQLGEQGVSDHAGLIQWLAEAPGAKRDRRRHYPMPRELRLDLPEGPGVYRMLDAAERILYVGKATSLRQRVNSYFRKQRGHGSRLYEMLAQAVRLDVTPTPTPLHAALLETDEIKRLSPPYNILLQSAGRTLSFYDAELSACERPEAVRYGPFPRADALEPLFVLGELIRDDTGVELTPRALLALAIKMARSETHNVSEGDAEDTDTADESSTGEAKGIEAKDGDSTELDPIDLLFMQIRAIGHQALRAKRLLKLTRSTVRWTDPASQRPQRVTLNLDASKLMSVSDYDRASVLDAELRRLDKHGVTVTHDGAGFPPLARRPRKETLTAAATSVRNGPLSVTARRSGTRADGLPVLDTLVDGTHLERHDGKDDARDEKECAHHVDDRHRTRRRPRKHHDAEKHLHDAH